MKKIFLKFFPIFFVCNLYLTAQTNLSQSDQIQIKSNLEFLASDELQGRNAASPMERIASNFIATEFMKYGVDPFGDDGTYFQNFKVHSYYNDPGSKIVITSDDSSNNLELNLGYDCAALLNLSINPEVVNKQFDLVFVGYGITAPEYGYDDYSDIDVTGKIVIAYPDEPHSTDENFFSGMELTEYSGFNSKLRNALKKGAAGILIIPGDDLLPIWHILRKQSLERKMLTDNGAVSGRKIAPPIAILSPEIIDGIFAGEEFSYFQINKIAESGKSPSAFKMKKKVSFDIKTKESDAVARNVVGIIEGTDPELKDEYIVLGAHYDHVGMLGEEIYNGADDNGSGTVAVMEVAKKLAEKKSNKRSIIVALFTAEEKDLNGSKWLSEHLDSSKVAAMVNIDMCGRGSIDSISTLGAGISSKELNDIVHEINASSTNFVITEIEEHLDEADHYPFFLKGIPVVTFYDAMEEDLHKTTDDTWKINFPKVFKTVYLVESIVLRLANDFRKPAYTYKDE